MDELIKEISNLFARLKAVRADIEEIQSYMEKALHEPVETILNITENCHSIEPNKGPGRNDFLNSNVDLPEFLISAFGASDHLPFKAVRLFPNPETRCAKIQVDIKLTARILQVVWDYKKQEEKDVILKIKQLTANAVPKIEA